MEALAKMVVEEEENIRESFLRCQNLLNQQDQLKGPQEQALLSQRLLKKLTLKRSKMQECWSLQAPS